MRVANNAPDRARAMCRRLRRGLALAGTAVLAAGLLSACGGSDGGAAAAGRAPNPPPSAPPTFTRYVALGDSFTAAPLVPVTDVANGCFRSSANYPALVARATGAEVEDRSCGGATTAHMRRAQFPGVPPQLSALDNRTDLVTFSIGGNDNRVFQQLVGRCPALRDRDPDGSPCRAAMGADGRDLLLSGVQRAHRRIVAALREVERRAPDAKVLVVGYPQLASSDDECSLLPLARGDHAYALEVNRAMSESLRRAARTTGATYVDVFRASRGHHVCSGSPWVNGAVADQGRAAAYHPFAEGQRAVADLIIDELSRRH